RDVELAEWLGAESNRRHADFQSFPGSTPPTTPDHNRQQPERLRSASARPSCTDVRGYSRWCRHTPGTPAALRRSMANRGLERSATTNTGLDQRLELRCRVGHRRNQTTGLATIPKLRVVAPLSLVPPSSPWRRPNSGTALKRPWLAMTRSAMHIRSAFHPGS